MQHRILVAGLTVLLGTVALTVHTHGQQAPPAGRGQAPQGEAARGRGAAAPAVRPPLFFRETWKQPPYTGTLDDPARRLTPAAVTNANLELNVYGPCKTSTLGVEVYGTPDDTLFPMNLWTGMCEAPVAVTLRDKANFVDLSDPGARIHWMFRAGNLHEVHPVLKLADGTLIVGDHADRTPTAPGQAQPMMVESEFTLAPLRWYQLTPDKVFITRPVDKPDLSKVDEVGFADLMPSGGHGSAGWINVGPMQVYGKPVRR